MPTIAPGEDWAAKVAANPNGTVFGILGDAANPHLGATCIPKPGNQFLADTPWIPGSTAHPVLDGQGVTVYAINGGTAAQPADVVVRGLEVKNYNSPAQQAAVRAGDGGNNQTTGFIADGLYIHDCANIGFRIGHGTRLLGGRFSFNTRLGIGGVGDYAIVRGTTTLGKYRPIEIDNNDPTNADIGFESGGSKFVKTTGLLVEDFWVHHNQGNGLWCDINNQSFTFRNGLTEDNLNNGISSEISYEGLYERITSRRNGFNATPGPAGSAGLAVHHSGGQGFEIRYCFLDCCALGVGLTQSQRGAGAGEPDGPFPYLTQNVYIHHNIIVMRPDSFGAIYAVDDSGTTMGPANAIFTSRNNRSNLNKLYLNQVAQPFGWMNAVRSLAAWQGFGHDLGSTVKEVLATFQAGDPYV